MTALHDLAMQIRYDLTAAQSKLTELIRQISDLPETVGQRLECPNCGLSFRGPNTLAEHQHVSHDGPIPEHWQRADALVADTRRTPPPSDFGVDKMDLR